MECQHSVASQGSSGLTYFSLQIMCQAMEKGNGSISYKAVIFYIEFKRQKRASETFFSNEAAQLEVNGEDKLLEAVQCGAVPLTTFSSGTLERESESETQREEGRVTVTD